MNSPYFERSFRSRDAAESEQWLAEQHGSVQLSRDFGGYGEDLVGDRRFIVTSITMLGTFSISSTPHMFFAASGTPGTLWETGRESGSLAADPGIFGPGRTVRSTVANSQCGTIGLTAIDLQRTARLLYATNDLELLFDSPRPAGPRAAAYWLGALEVGRREAATGALSNDLVRAGTYRMLAVSALESFRPVAERRDLHASAERRVSIYRAGSEFLRDHASLPVTIDDAAQAAGASVRELVLAFRSHADGALGPTAFLKKVRLGAARDDLATSVDTIGEVALRWGFADEQAFAAHYLTEYGSAPVSSGPIEG